jgi:hypothetical protein
VTQLLGQAIRAVKRLHKANKQRKELAAILERHRSELDSADIIMGIITDEKSLRTASVESELARMEDIIQKLVHLLEDIDPVGQMSPARQLAHQFVHGCAQEKRMAKIMGELAQVKMSLLLCIQTANVGVVRSIKDNMVANMYAINRVESLLKEELGEGAELKIARLVKGRRPSSE